MTHSSSKPKEEENVSLSKRVKEFKFEDDDDLLTVNFETGFDDDLEAILGVDFVGMVTILLAEFKGEAKIESDKDDFSDVFLGQECLFVGEDPDEKILFEKSNEVMKSHL